MTERAASGELSAIELGCISEPYRELRSRNRAQVSRLAAALLEDGQRSPVFVVARAGEAHSYVLIDGHARTEALRRAGEETVQAIVLGVDEAAALCLCFRFAGGRRPSALEEAWLVGELIDRHALTLGGVARELERSKSWVSRRLALVRELPERVQDLVRSGSVCAHGAVRSLLPLARANAAASERIAEIVAEHGLSSRQTAKLAAAYRSARGTQRAQILDHPLLYLKAEQQVSRGGSEHEASGLVHDLEILSAVARRVVEGLRTAAGGEQAGAALTLVWPRTQRALEHLWVAVEERIGVGSGNENSDPAAAL